MSPSDEQARLADALVDFAKNRTFPEEEAVSAAHLEGPGLPYALQVLNGAKLSLEDEVRKISREDASDVESWMAHAQSLQTDIEKSKRLASDIVRQAEADEIRLEALHQQRTYVAFLEKEAVFTRQLGEALQSIQKVNECLDKADKLVGERNILDPLRLLEEAWTIIDTIPADKSARAVRLLDARCFDLRNFVHEQLTSIWRLLVVVDYDNRVITINKKVEGEVSDMDDALIALKAYRELEKAANQLWEDLDEAILKPRTDLPKGALRSIQIQENIISVGNKPADHNIKSLFLDIEDIVRFLVQNLPAEFIKHLSNAMMPTLSTRIKEAWLDTAVPASLDDLVEYQKSLAQVQDFASKLESLQWPGADGFYDWVANAPKIWLSKRRETSLDWTRNQLALGVGNPQLAEHIERQMVGRNEGMQIASTGNMLTQDWDAAWESEDEDKVPPRANRASHEEERQASKVVSPEMSPATTPDGISMDDDAADAWGWGDDDGAESEPASGETPEAPAAERPPMDRHITPETREVTLSEPYWTSSMPQPVFKTITGIFNDGARLTSHEFEHVPITSAAPGLFSLPTLVLAMYRAVSPYYYSSHPSGNMFIYNDSIWLCDRLKEYASEWERRDDLTSRAYGKVKLDPEIKTLESFGKRAYTNELNSQRTVIADLLSGAQNFFQQDGSLKGELDEDINNVVGHIRKLAAAWNQILPYSAWASSVGSLVNAVATKIITDVFDLNDVGVDEAERIATLISKVTELDDLFVRKSKSQPEIQHNAQNGENGEEAPIPMTAQFADKWMKLKFLSEVLQSNLKDIKYFWFESDLSLYFTADEVVDLINLSFENNASVRQAIREIKDKPIPRQELIE